MTHPRLEATIGLLSELVAFPTVSAQSNITMIARLADLLEGTGAQVDLMFDDTGTKANLFATIGPDRDGGIVLSGHTDVVPVTDQPWTTDPFAMVTRDGRLYGRGTCDMKGFLAAALAMVPTLGAHVRDRPLHFAFTHDEEVGCLGAQNLVRALRARGQRPAMVLVGEPTGLRTIEGHKGCHEYTTRFTGLEGHGSTPELGINAVEYAARFVGKLLDLKAQLRAAPPAGSRFDPPWSTINTGALSGGIAHNVIPGRAHVDWEMRPVTAADAAHVMRELAAFCNDVLLPEMRAIHPDAAILTDVIGEVDGFEPRAANAARDLVMEITGANHAGLVPFGTEAGLFQSLGCDVVICGPGEIAQAHKPDEYLAIDQLDQCLHMLDRLALRL